MSSVPLGVCFICRTTVEEGKVTIVKRRGIQTLIEVSKKRGLVQNKQFLSNLNEVTVHDACRKRYSVESNVLASVRRGGDALCEASTSRRHRDSSALGSKVHLLENICFLCGENITSEFLKHQQKLPISRRNLIHQVESLSMKDTILEIAARRGDEWGQQIIQRLACISDLVAAEGRYHQLCHKNLYHMPSKRTVKRGRPEPTNLLEGMERIYAYLAETRDECQFSLNDLITDNFTGDYKPDIRSAKAHLARRYGERIMFTEVGRGRNSIMSFKDIGQKILYDNWYNERKSNPAEERLRVVQAAAQIILEDIRSQTVDTTQYPPSDEFLKDANDCVPESLTMFLETIVLKYKRASLDAWKKKCVGISHAIMVAVRPKSFLSSIQISFGTYLYRKFGSKHLVNLCNAMGFSCTYTEAMRVESSAILRGEINQQIERGAFMQFVWDNADVNVNTLDGENTFHEMGGIMIITPYSSVVPDENIPRLKYVSADLISSHVVSQLKQSTVKKNDGLSAISVIDLKIAADILPTALDLLWLYGKSTNTQGIPGWNGFMEQVTEDLNYNRSKIIFLPFIHAPPTDYDTVLTSLLEASERTTAHSQKTCFVTYDQPLYMKARDIVESCQHPHLRCVVVRLGGFHLLMSFMGAIGAIMAGSGLKELLTTIYAENSVEKILNGHAYSRAVRAHMLTNLALANLILSDNIQLTDQERLETEKILNSNERCLLQHATKNKTVQILISKLKTAMNELQKKSPTSKLWVQYYKMTTLMKKFIQAERMGDWELHLDTIREMLPFFHSAGHFLYAKSARLYLQDMHQLKERMDPEEYRLFTQEGQFTIRRSHKFWSGLWTDLTIEQVLMRSMKSQGGLTHGRGISSSVLARWTGGAVYMLNICQGLEYFWEVSCTISEQHVDMRASQIERDHSDVDKLKNWFDIHTPFPSNERILSISSGIVGGPEVNCHMAQELGIDGVKQITGKSFGKVGFKRKDKVRTLATATIKVQNKQVQIDPLTIFQRLCITKQTDNDLKDNLKYELAPYPIALFCEEGMRKGTKSRFYSAFTALPENISIDASTFVVVDGGYLLHKVIWHRNDSIKAIVVAYISYIFKHFGMNVAVVFDGYPENGAERSTKTAERLRRYAVSSCSDILFQDSTLIKVSQEKLLSNDNNKRRLIDFLCSEFKNQGIQTKRAIEDADCLIVNTALDMSSSYEKVIVVGEDVDLLVLLNGLGSTVDNVFFQKSGRGESGFQQFSSTSFNRKELSLPLGFELFLHAFTGCDTTSALFRHGKMKVLDVLKKHPQLVNVATIFLQSDATPEEISSAGNKLLVAMYGGRTDSTLHDLRYEIFIRSAANSKVHLGRLPPTEEAAAQHSYRTYHQVQMWLGKEIEPTDWGWIKSPQGLVPMTSTKDPASQTLLKLLSCKCRKGCSGGGCTCQKAGLKCSALCKFCRGKSCQNTPTIEIEESDDEEGFDKAVPDEILREESVVTLLGPPDPPKPGPSKRFKF